MQSQNAVQSQGAVQFQKIGLGGASMLLRVQQCDLDHEKSGSETQSNNGQDRKQPPAYGTARLRHMVDNNNCRTCCAHHVLCTTNAKHSTAPSGLDCMFFQWHDSKLGLRKAIRFSLLLSLGVFITSLLLNHHSVWAQSSATATSLDSLIDYPQQQTPPDNGAPRRSQGTGTR